MAKLLPILQSKWFAAIFSAVSFLSISVFFTLHAAKTLVQKPAPAAEEQPEDAQDVAERNHNQPSWNFTNPEIDELVRDLREERGALAKRREQMLALEVRLRAEREELTRLQQNVKKMQEDFDKSVTAAQADFDNKISRAQEDFDKNVTRVQEEEVANLKRLAKTYAAMEPAAAAAIMRELADPVIVKIMLFMKESETAPVFEALARPNELAAKRAALVSERLRLAISRKAVEKPKS